MIDIKIIEKTVEEALEGSDQFLVEVKKTPSNEIEVIVDSDSRIGIERCIELSRMIEEKFDREAEDFELTVASAGIGQPLKLLRQYRKVVDKEVEVVLKDGMKLVATLKEAAESFIIVEYTEKVAVEGKKRKESIQTLRTLPLDDIKCTTEHIKFK